MRDADLKDLSRFLSELQSETDRGLALVGASVLDDKLRATLAAFFVECTAVERLLDAGNAPLGSFSARTDACLALGLIDNSEHAEITLIRKVRNEFAHGLHGTNFQTEPIRGFCANLQSPLPVGAGHPTGDGRFRVINSIVCLITRLYYRPEHVSRERRTAKEWTKAGQVGWRVTEHEKPPEGVPVLGIFARGKGFRKVVTCERCGQEGQSTIYADGFDDAPTSFVMTETCKGCEPRHHSLSADKMHELTGLPLTGWSHTKVNPL